MDRLIKWTFLSIPLLFLLGGLIAVFGPIIWIIIFNPVILGIVAFVAIFFLLSKMKKEDSSKDK